MTAEAKIKISAEGVDAATAKFRALAGSMASVGSAGAGMYAKAKGAVAQLATMRNALAGAGAVTFASFVKDSIKAADAAEKATRGYLRMGGSRESLERLREALGGVVDDSDLAMIGAEALRANSKMTAQQFEDVALYARKAASDVGGEYLPTLQALNEALVTGRPAMLRRLGLHVDLDAAIKKATGGQHEFNAKLGDTQRRGIITAAVLAEIRKQLKGVPPAASSASSELSRFAANWSQLKEHMGVGFAEMLGGPLENLNKAIEGKPGARGKLAETIFGLGAANPFGAYGIGKRVAGMAGTNPIADARAGVTLVVDKIVFRKAGGD